MTLPRRRFLHLALGAAALPQLPRFAMADTYPSRPIMVVVPFAPGGPTAVLVRTLGEPTRAALGHDQGTRRDRCIAYPSQHGGPAS